MAEVKDDEGENSVIDNWANTHDTSLCDSEAAEWHHFAQASSDHWDVSYSCGLVHQNAIQPETGGIYQCTKSTTPQIPLGKLSPVEQPSSQDLIQEKLMIIHQILRKSWNTELANMMLRVAFKLEGNVSNSFANSIRLYQSRPGHVCTQFKAQEKDCPHIRYARIFQWKRLQSFETRLFDAPSKVDGEVKPETGA